MEAQIGLALVIAVPPEVYSQLSICFVNDKGRHIKLSFTFPIAKKEAIGNVKESWKQAVRAGKQTEVSVGANGQRHSLHHGLYIQILIKRAYFVNFSLEPRIRLRTEPMCSNHVIEMNLTGTLPYLRGNNIANANIPPKWLPLYGEIMW
ncbi:hypothetical protein CEXT_80651 [Caerostris extrusa]|uniref:Uncharacterized protein n=1 Tax=Caerostris extrusa TaxID=172846 RepID=A0AAV4TKI5_CAEEX|nr:hypothetical protein CEXT_80651 [Caerostris extrusa]